MKVSQQQPKSKFQRRFQESFAENAQKNPILYYPTSKDNHQTENTPLQISTNNNISKYASLLGSKALTDYNTMHSAETLSLTKSIQSSDRSAVYFKLLNEYDMKVQEFRNLERKFIENS